MLLGHWLASAIKQKKKKKLKGKCNMERRKKGKRKY